MPVGTCERDKVGDYGRSSVTEMKIVAVKHDNDMVHITFSDDSYALLVRDHYDAIIGQGVNLAKEIMRIMKGLQ